VTFKSVWELHESAREGSPPCGRFCAGVPSVSTTALKPANAHEDEQLVQLVRNQLGSRQLRMYARLLQSGVESELRVWFSPGAKQLICPKMGSVKALGTIWSKEHEVGYVTHPSQDGADIAVEVCYPESPNSANAEAIFRLCDPQAISYGVAELKHRKPALQHEVETVLFAAAQWNWHLRRTNPHSANVIFPTLETQNMVSIEIMKIAEKVKFSGTRNLSNRGRKFLPGPHVNLNMGGVADFVAQETDLYGIKLINNMGVPLYVRMFYFDATDFSIGEFPPFCLSLICAQMTNLGHTGDMFGHSTSNCRADPDLLPYGEVMIGDGGEGGAPLKFTITPGNEIELGYIKVFWSTDPLELDNLEQESAFKMKQNVGSRKVLKGGVVRDWGSVVLTLVQRAPPESRSNLINSS
jgi:hypothetical protein